MQIPTLLTRPKSGNAAFRAGLSADTVSCLYIVESPLIEIVPTGRGNDIPPDTGAIFTSANGVRNAPRGAQRPAYCVGAQTTEVARTAGWVATQAGEDAEGLLKYLIEVPPGHALKHFRGVHQRGNIVQRLRDAGLFVTDDVVYDQQQRALSDEAKEILSGQNPVLVPLFSPRTARVFAGQVAPAAPLHVLAISPAVVDALRDIVLAQIVVSPGKTAAGMTEAFEKMVRSISLG